MTALWFFDSSCLVGRWGRSQAGAFLAAQNLLKNMDYFGIERALVCHALGRDGSAAVGNSLLEKELGGHDRLEPMWILLPEFFENAQCARRLEEELRSRRVRAARIFPSSARHNFSVRDWLCRRLLEFLEERRMPLFIERNELSWEDWGWLLSQHHDLPVVMVNPGYRNERRLLPLLESRESLYLEASTFVGHRRMSAFVRRFGAGRMLFGTQMPLWDPGAILAILAYAEIEPEERADIASRNLDRLLEAARA